MCGIVGVRSESGDGLRLQGLIGGMTRRLAHRGPDSDGVWLDQPNGIALGHTRLAIIDLSAAGRQPMTSRSGRYVITYNGELYNYRELRRDLPAGHISSSSDTEVLLECISAWGIHAALKRFNGMFAFGLWDRLTQTLSLATDRMGEKPLYYATIGPDIVFASELKALEVHDAFAGELDESALGLYLQKGFVPAPRSIYKNVFKLEPGSIAAFRREAAVEVRRYWSAPQPSGRIMSRDPETAIESLEEILSDSVRLRLRADVPVGVFFSGGIDSTAVLARARRVSTGRVTAFTVGFEESNANEAPHARRLAEHLDCEYVEATLTSRDALSIIPDLASIYDEPFGDPSSVATCLLARMAKQHVTVALSGDGADELFGGYWRYRWAQQLWPLLGRTPAAARLGTSRMLHGLARATRALASVHPAVPRFSTRLGRVSQCLASTDTATLYEGLTAQVDGAAFLSSPGAHAEARWTRATSRDQMLEQLMWLDTTDYLPNDILVKVDRATMAVALEARLPFLDHRLVEFAMSLPVDLRLRGRVGKWIVKQMLYRDIPRRLIDRPKQGFSLPVAEWLRDPLRDWAEDLLRVERLREQPLISAVAVRRQWSEHLTGLRDWQYSLWPLLMFLAWERRVRQGRIRSDRADDAARVGRERTAPATSGDASSAWMHA
jgi:asparagine synthase (glutamine-hydrolysing)